MSWAIRERHLIPQGVGSLRTRTTLSTSARRSAASSSSSLSSSSSPSSVQHKARHGVLYSKIGSLRRRDRQSQSEATWSNPFASFAQDWRGENITKKYRPVCSREMGANWVTIGSVPTADTAGCGLVMHFDNRRYHFGSLSEGTQRYYTQRGFSHTKLTSIFVSGQTTWSNLGGLFGTMLTAADALSAVAMDHQASNALRKKEGKQLLAPITRRLEVFGGENLAYTVATARNFIFRQGLPISATDFDQDPRTAAAAAASEPAQQQPDYNDEYLRIWSVPVTPDTLDNGTKTSSRKRSHDRMEAEDALCDHASADAPTPASATVTPTPTQTQTTDDDAIKQKQASAKKAAQVVVDAMFNSHWKFDKLVPTKLKNVDPMTPTFVRENGEYRKYQGPWCDQDPSLGDKEVHIRTPWPGAEILNLPETASSHMALSYVVKNKGKRGKFRPQEAIKLGVEKRNFGLLTGGKTVKGKDGIDVTPEMVLEDPIPGMGFAICDIPSPAHVQKFIDRPEWVSDTVMEGVHAFYWNLGRGLIDDPRLQEFIKSRPDVKHIIMAPDVSPNMLTFESSALLTTKLRRIDPGRFPLLHFDNTSKDLSFLGSNVIVGRPGMKFNFLPSFSVDDSGVVPFATLEEVQNMDSKIVAMAKEAREKINTDEFKHEVERDEADLPGRDAEVTPLGTGSSQPSKYRNVSSTLVRVPGVGSYLFDCGEGTLGQLRRCLGEEKANQTLRDLKGIFISHMHADHHLGTAQILSEWHRLTADHQKSGPQLLMVAPDAMQTFLHEHSQVEDVGFKRILFKRCAEASPALAHCGSSGLKAIAAVSVRHCFQAYAFVATWESGLKIAYSGDCRPSRDFAEAGKGATLLIHESTFEDDKLGDARAKKHSTMSEALDIGERMMARRVLLTHFSQRYAKITKLGSRTVPAADSEGAVAGGDGSSTTAAKKEQIVLLAFDQMSVKIGEFKHAAAFLPAISKLLSEHEDSKDGDEDTETTQ